MMSVYSDQPAYLYAAAEMYLTHYFSILDKSYMYELMCRQYSPSVLIAYKLCHTPPRHLHVMCFLLFSILSTSIHQKLLLRHHDNHS